MRLIEIKLTLLDIRPRVWRKLLVSPDIRLGKLHRIIQVTMGWQDTHFHRFNAGSESYSDPRFRLEDGSKDERKILVGDLLAKPGDRLSYEYDFGDDWQHELRCEGFVESDVQTPYVLCTDGARACPPEDCGGAPGYHELLHVLENPKHREYTRAREWVGRRFSPEGFSVDETNSFLSRFFRRKASTSIRPSSSHS